MRYYINALENIKQLGGQKTSATKAMSYFILYFHKSYAAKKRFKTVEILSSVCTKESKESKVKPGLRNFTFNPSWLNKFTFSQVTFQFERFQCEVFKNNAKHVRNAKENIFSGGSKFLLNQV